MVRTGNAVTARSLSQWRYGRCVGDRLDARQGMPAAWRVGHMRCVGCVRYVGYMGRVGWPR